MIALADRYALGFWSTDAYALQLNIVKAGSSGVQQVANAGAFYTSSWAATAMDNRYKHALSHKNTKLGGKTWAELDDVIYAFEPQNEPQGVSRPSLSSSIETPWLTVLLFSTWTRFRVPGPATVPRPSSPSFPRAPTSSSAREEASPPPSRSAPGLPPATRSTSSRSMTTAPTLRPPLTLSSPPSRVRRAERLS